MSYETEKVQPSVCIFGPLEAREDGLVFVELALLNRNVDPDDILPHDAPCTNIQMSVFPCQSAESSGQMTEDNGERTDPTSEFPMSPSESPTASP
jgi:hypothetical protein